MIPAKKSLGQNFLKSKEALRAIVEAGDIQPTDTILEVGPGKGVLTEMLVEKAEKVIAVEKDDRLIALLQEKFQKEMLENKLEILNQDILEFGSEKMGEYKIIANIPYYITGSFLQKFLETNNQPSRMVLMLQKEVAKRIVGEKESILSLSVKAYGTPKYVMTVKAKYFSPQPKVDSAVIQITDITKTFFDTISEQQFFQVVKAGFAHKRKMLLGNLKNIFTDKNLDTLFEDINLDKKVRGEDVKLEHWKKLAEKIFN